MRVIITVLLIFTAAAACPAQLKLYIPKHITINVNDSLLRSDSLWSAQLPDRISRGSLKHSIAGFHVDNELVYTKIRLPQTLSKAGVVENIIRYYCLLQNESDREDETLLVYPLFVKLTDTAHVSSRYESGGNFFIHFKTWKTIPVPDEPGRNEKNIFNQLLKYCFAENLDMESIPDWLFKRVAAENEVNQECVADIYKKVYLWQRSR